MNSRLGGVGLWQKGFRLRRSSHRSLLNMDKACTIANAIELLHLNQIAIRAAIEDVNTWIRQRGSVNAHENVMTTLQTLDKNADAVGVAIEQLRKV